MRQFALDIGIDNSPSFDNYVEGNNSAPLAHLKLWAASVKRSPVPTYLWGLTGSGKSHLLEAVRREVEGLGEHVVTLNPSSSLEQPYADEWTVAILDDVHLYTAELQHQAFSIYVDAQKHQRWVLAAGSLPPVDLGHVREDLRTRLGWGHVYELLPLSEAESRAVLRQEADARGILLHDDVMQYILTRCSRDMTSLIRLLDEMDGYAMSLKKGKITIPMVKDVLESKVQL